jgi:hypothetical protein
VDEQVVELATGVLRRPGIQNIGPLGLRLGGCHGDTATHLPCEKRQLTQKAVTPAEPPF